MCGSVVDMQYATAEIRRGKKIEERRNHRTKNIMSVSAMQGGHKNAAKKENQNKVRVMFNIKLQLTTTNVHVTKNDM